MNKEEGTKINRLLWSIVPDGLIFSDWLKRHGYSDQLQKRYRDMRWFDSLCKGVMYRPKARLSAYSSLSSYNKQLEKNCRVAAHTALEYEGYNHYVPMGKPTFFAGLPNGEKKAPAWMKYDVFDMNIRTFSTTAFNHQEVSKIDTDFGVLYVSSAEQAFLECLLLAPLQYDYVDLYYIMEQLSTLRPELVQRLLENLDNYRVKRVFLYMAEKAQHQWFTALDLEKIDLGSGKLQLVKSGTFIPKYKITVPKELESYE